MTHTSHDLVRRTLEECSAAFEAYIKESRPAREKDVPAPLFAAMEYSLTAGGKRLRPALCMSAANVCGAGYAQSMPMALGLEMFHTASLIHDDLPCMDDDDMRRGRPSNHKVFGEAMAVLAGDSLMLAAFEYPLTSLSGIDPARVLRALRIFSKATGPSGVCGGQALDMEDSRVAEPGYVANIASLKTAALIRASVLCGAALGTDDEKQLACFSDYGWHLGMAFQIVDDILDVIGTTEQMGKSTGKDAEQNKVTHVTVFGLEAARQMAVEQSLAAKRSLSGILSEDDFLMILPEYLVNRTN